ncbi:MAG: HU family DNA-binding protein [Muribaculaceae bacterium]|nr:HU family DNA-binding protein [Muribaculaceae bacterium]
MKETTNLNKLQSLLSSATGLDVAKAEQFVQALTEYIIEGISKTKSVEIPGLGIFKADPEADNIVFEPDKNLADAINEPFSFFEAVELDVDPEILNDSSKEENTILNENVNASVEINQDTPDRMPEDEDVQPMDMPMTTDDTEKSIDLAEVAGTSDQTEGTDSFNRTDEGESENTDNQEVEFIEVTRPRPVIAGVLAGLFAGILIGLLSHDIIFPDNKSQAIEDISTETTGHIIDSARIKVAHVDSLHVENLIADEINDSYKPAPENHIITDTVTTTRFLATMARKYYGVMEYWIYIYEENKDRLPHNPNQIRPGTVVTIPPIDKYVTGDDRAKNRAEASRKIAEVEQRLRQKS